MSLDFWDFNSLTLSELEEITHLQKALSLSPDQAMQKWMANNPGRIKHVGETKGNEFVINEISEEGVKELKGAEAISKLIHTALKKEGLE